MNTRQKLENIINNMEVCYIEDFEGKNIILIKESGYLIGSMFVDGKKCIPTGIDVLNRIKHKYFYALNKFDLCLESIDEFEVIKLLEGGKLNDLTKIERFDLDSFNLVLGKKEDDRIRFDLNLLSSDSLFLKYLSEYIHEISELNIIKNKNNKDYILDKYHKEKIDCQNNIIKKATQKINKIRKERYSGIETKVIERLYDKYGDKLMFLIFDLDCDYDNRYILDTESIYRIMLSIFFDREVMVRNFGDIFRVMDTTIKLNCGEVRLKSNFFQYSSHIEDRCDVMITLDINSVDSLNLGELNKIKGLLEILNDIENIDYEIQVMCYSPLDSNVESKEINEESSSKIRKYLLGEINEIG